MPTIDNCPRIIWTLWLQGWEIAPDIVRRCTESWTRQNPSYVVNRLDEDTLHKFLPPETVDYLLSQPKEPEALSDQIRIELLAAHGGVWVDATTFCARPLDQWLSEAMTSGFFAFEKPVETRLLASWFLASERNGYISRVLARATRTYWHLRESRDDYFWFHNLFRQKYINDEIFRDIWDRTLKISAVHDFHFSPYDPRLIASIDENYRENIEHTTIPVFKLTHKLPTDYPGDSVLNEILRI